MDIPYDLTIYTPTTWFKKDNQYFIFPDQRFFGKLLNLTQAIHEVLIFFSLEF